MRKRLIGSVLVLLLLALVVGGRHIYQNRIHQTQTKAQEQLQAIARLKVEQIVAWRSERLGDGEVLKHNANLTSRLLRWLYKPAAPESAKILQDDLAEFQRQYGYQDHWLVDASGQMRIHNGVPVSGQVSSELQDAVAEAWRSRRARSLSDLTTIIRFIS